MRSITGQPISTVNDDQKAEQLRNMTHSAVKAICREIECCELHPSLCQDAPHECAYVRRAINSRRQQFARAMTPMQGGNVLKAVGITVSLDQAFHEYALSLESSVQAAKFWDAHAAVIWWQRGGLWWRFWRHGVYPLLCPFRYRRIRMRMVRGRAENRQAIMNAVLAEGEKMVADTVKTWEEITE